MRSLVTVVVIVYAAATVAMDAVAESDTPGRVLYIRHL